MRISNVGYLHPMDAALLEMGLPASAPPFPPREWKVVEGWGGNGYGNGYALQHPCGLRLILDCEKKADDRWWLHVSVSRKSWAPSHTDMCTVKQAFIGNRYAYAVYPPEENYVNIHHFCLHLWSLVDGESGAALPEFSEILPGIGRSI